jgi:hypothetical protein
MIKKIVILIIFIFYVYDSYLKENNFILNKFLKSKFNCRFNKHGLEMPILVNKNNKYNINCKILCSRKIQKINIIVFDRDQFIFDINYIGTIFIFCFLLKY